MSIPNTALSNVFVYGTLKREMFNHRILEVGNANSSKFIGVAETSKPFKFSMLLSTFGFPYLIEDEDSPSATNTAVRGEVYRVDQQKLEELDILEDIASGLYKRSVIEVELLTDENDEKISVEEGEKNILSAFVYIAGHKEDKRDLARIEEYTKEIHDEKYIPKASRGDW